MRAKVPLLVPVPNLLRKGFRGSEKIQRAKSNTCFILIFFFTFAPTKWGALIVQAEIKPVEPDAGNAAEGRKIQHFSVRSYFLI